MRSSPSDETLGDSSCSIRSTRTQSSGPIGLTAPASEADTSIAVIEPDFSGSAPASSIFPASSRIRISRALPPWATIV